MVAAIRVTVVSVDTYIGPPMSELRSTARHSLVDDFDTFAAGLPRIRVPHDRRLRMTTAPHLGAGNRCNHR